MIYLVRTTRVLKMDEGFEEATKKLTEHLGKAYPQIKKMKFLWNVTGPIDEMHWVLSFESLADEDAWATKVIADDVYRNWFMASEGVIGPMVDQLYRESPM